MSLAQRVRDFRYSKGWGPDELASRAAISRTALYQIESGKTELPRAGTLRRIAMALDVSMDALLGHPEPAGGPRPAEPAATSGRPPKGEWLPSEGGPLAIPAPRPGAPGVMYDGRDGARFAIDLQTIPSPMVDSFPSARDRELSWKLRDLLASPLGDGVARIVEELHRLMLQNRSVSQDSRF